jgi:prevent-host-death family protein
MAQPAGPLSQRCYSCRMGEIASRDLRNDTRGVLNRVAGGEDVVITVGGQPVAVLMPLRQRPRWVSRAEFVRRFSGRQTDVAVADELAELAPDTTDDLPL